MRGKVRAFESYCPGRTTECTRETKGLGRFDYPDDLWPTDPLVGCRSRVTRCQSVLMNVGTFVGESRAIEIITATFGEDRVPTGAGIDLLEETVIETFEGPTEGPRGVAWRGALTFRTITLDVENLGQGDDNTYTSRGDWIDIEVLADLVRAGLPGLRDYAAPLDVFITMVEITHEP